MARAFSTFANGGNRIDGSILGNVPRAITQIGTGKNRNRTAPSRIACSARRRRRSSTRSCRRSSPRAPATAPRFRDRPVAGKTGTTENYGDAWFVGYLPQLTVAVWVGYPRELKSMKTEYHGEPVAGGTFPGGDLEYVHGEGALPYLPHRSRSRSRRPTSPYGSPREVVFRDGLTPARQRQLPLRAEPALLRPAGAEQTANCKPNEVDVPDLIGQNRWRPLARGSSGSRSRRRSSTRSAKPGRAPNIVLGQKPSKGRLSAYDHVTLVVAKPMHGVVPQLVGLPVGGRRGSASGAG